MESISALREKRATLAAQAKAILSRADGERRGLTSTETAEFDRFHGEIDTLAGKILRTEKQDTIERELSMSQGRRAVETGTIVDDSYVAEARALPRETSMVDYVKRTDSEARDQAERFRAERVTLGGVLHAMIDGRTATEAENRALSEGTNSAGGFTVPTILAASFIDALRKRMRVFLAGARIFPLDSNKHNIARILTDVVPAWRAEAGAVGETDIVFEQVPFVAKTVANLTRVSRELFEDSVNINQAIERSISQSFALEMDRVALVGSGASNQPTGIVNTAGIGTVASSANGDQITNYSKLVTAKQTLLDANNEGPFTAIMAPRSSAKFGGMLDTTGQPVVRPQFLDDVAFLDTTQIGVTDTQGTSTNASKIIVGDYRALMVGMRTDLTVELLRERYADTLQYGFVAYLRADIQLEHPASFVNVSGLIP